MCLYPYVEGEEPNFRFYPPGEAPPEISDFRKNPDVEFMLARVSSTFECLLDVKWRNKDKWDTFICGPCPIGAY